MLQRWVIAALLALLATSAWAQGRAARVHINEVRSEPINQTLPIIGRVVPRQSGIIAARVAGAVMSVAVQVGDRVDKGDVIVVQDDALRRAELSRAQAEIAIHSAKLSTANAKLELAQQEMKRLIALKGSAAFPKARYEDQRQEVVRFGSEVREARAALSRAEANKRIGEIGLERTTVKASYSGVILQRHTSLGAYLRPGDGVVTMLNDNEMELEVDVPTDRLGGLAVGTGVTFELASKARFSAVVRAIIPDENPLTRTRSVRLTPAIEGPRKLVRNESVVVDVPIGEPRTILSVHKDAVLNRRGKQIVYVVVDEAAQVRPVRLGEAVGARFEVLSGLNRGERVVVRGNERLRPGQKVQFERGS